MFYENMALLIQNNFDFELVIGVSERVFSQIFERSKNLPNFITANYGRKKHSMGKCHLIFILTLVSDYTVNLLFLDAAVKFDKF